MKQNITFLLTLLFTILVLQGQNTPQIWEDYTNAHSNGTQLPLPDFSYAGYHFSEKSIPDISSWTRFDITLPPFNAIPNDGNYDDDAIQAAINAAEAHNGPAIVFFPAGRFMVSSDNDINKFIEINRSHIVLQGSGTDINNGGTEIFMDKMRVNNGHWQFVFRPETFNTSTITQMTQPANRGDFSVQVANSSSLSIGQYVFINHKSEEFALQHFSPKQTVFGSTDILDPWYRLKNSYLEDGTTKSGGMSVVENHLITEINGNIITFKNPIQTDLPTINGKNYNIRNLKTIEEIGIENILFTGNWLSVGENFVHHKNEIHDYAWNAIQYKYVNNAWLRNCEFKNWCQAMDVRESIAVTIENSTISGEGLHASFLGRRNYGVLVKDCQDTSGLDADNGRSTATHHGPGVGYQSVNTVYLRYKMRKSQSVDSHSGQPYATLIDDTQGGDFKSNGGPYQSYPHHGKFFVFWNFIHNSFYTNSSAKTTTYRFWPTLSSFNRNGYTYASPYFIGFQQGNAGGGDIILDEAGIVQNKFEEVFPKSLFEAQLNLRLNSLSSNKIEFDDFKLFPNPYEDELSLHMRNNSKIKSLKIFSLTGKQIPASYIQTGKKVTINILIPIQTGIYLLEVSSSNATKQLKIVKK